MHLVKLDRILPPSPSHDDLPVGLAYATRLAEALDHDACRQDPELRQWVAACLLSAAPFPARLVIDGCAQ
jgi:hypothetical protein